MFIILSFFKMQKISMLNINIQKFTFKRFYILILLNTMSLVTEIGYA